MVPWRGLVSAQLLCGAETPHFTRQCKNARRVQFLFGAPVPAPPPAPPCECLSCCVFSHTMDSFECTRHSVKYVHRRRSVEGKKKKERKRPLSADDGPSLVLQKELVIDEDERAKTRVSVTAHRALRPSTIPWFLL